MNENGCQVEKIFGISLETHSNTKNLVIKDFLPEARAIYSPKVKKGYYLIKINGVDVNSYNLNNVIQRVAEDYNIPKLTFQQPNEGYNINLETLLTTKTTPDNALTQYIKESMCGVLYICCNDIEYNSNDDKGVLYCFPRPYNQNFLYNTRGAYVTLNHLAPKSLGTSDPVVSTVLYSGKLINVTYTQRVNDLLLLAFPNDEVDLFAAKKVIVDIVRVLEFLYGSLKSCFTKPNNVDKLDCIFSRIFVSLLGDSKRDVNAEKKSGNINSFEYILGAHAISLPLEVKVQVDDAITELEAADYREWVRYF